MRTTTPKAVAVRLQYEQEVDSNGPVGNGGNDLVVEVTDAGGGPYLVLQTERWALDPEHVDDFAALLRHALTLVKDAEP